MDSFDFFGLVVSSSCNWSFWIYVFFKRHPDYNGVHILLPKKRERERNERTCKAHNNNLAVILSRTP